MRKIYSIFTIFFIGISAFAQSGRVIGVLTDADNGETIPFANVLVKGSPNGVVADVGGNYELKLKPGIYDITYVFMGFEEQVKKEVEISANATIIIDVALAVSTFNLKDVVVSSTRVTNTETAVMIEMRKTAQIVSGISNEQIRKSQDNDAAQVVKRIAGVTITDDRFIVVRGLSNRYNNVLLNGIIAPSVEADSRSFSFDLIPSSMLDRILVFKSGASDIPADFAGALVKIYTRNTVDESFNNVNVTFGSRAGTTWGNFQTTGSKPLDVVGLGQINRQLPTDFPDDLRQYSFRPDVLVAEAKKFENDWQAHQKTALPDMRFKYEMGRKMKLVGKELTTLNAISYSNTNLVQDVTRFRYTGYDAAGKSVPFFSYNDNRSVNSVRMGLVSNWSYKPSANAHYEFRNFYNQSGNSETVLRTGVNQNRNVDEQNYSYRYESRNIYSGQLQGTHSLKKDRASVVWIAGFTASNRQEPDWRRAQSRRIMGSEGDFQLIIPNNANTQNASRFYTNLNESAATVVADYEYIINPETNFKIKAGIFSEYKWRTFQARTIGYIRASSYLDPSIEGSGIADIFTASNMYFPGGLMVGENTKYTDFYAANNLNAAAHIGSSIKLWKKLSLAGGLRFEYNLQKLETGFAPNGAPDQVSLLGINPLPFVNASYTLSEKSLLRASFGININRPEFRELAPFSYYNFDLNSDIVGNTNLKNATIYNYDLRYEFYPTAPEVISVGVFYKNFINPIEFIITTGADNPVYISQNAKSAMVYGAELEFRKSLTFISEKLNYFSALLNATVLTSQIDLGTNNTLTQAQKRPLQGQSPYIVNAGLYFNNTKGTQISLLYNVAGKRIFLVGDNEFPTQYEVPRNLLDLTITQSLSNKIEMKMGIIDILNSLYEVREDGNLDGKINNPQVDKPILKQRFGQYVQIGFTYKF